MKVSNARTAIRHRNHLIVSGTHLTRSALVLAIIFGAILGFWASSTSEHSEIPGVKSVVQIQSWTQNSHKADLHTEQLLGDLSEIAADHKAEILVEIPTLKGRTVYAAGHNANRWQQEGYRSLPGSPSVEVQPLNKLPHGDYRQMFELTGGKDFLHAITSYLDDHGVQYLIPQNQQWTFLLEGTALGKLSTLTIGVGFALSFIGIVLNSHAEAVRRLHGIGIIGRVKAEVFTAGRNVIPVTIATVVAVDVTLWICSNTASVQQLALFQAMFIGVALVACIVAIFFGLIMLKIASVVQLLKGKLPVKSVLFSMFTLRLGACIAVASFCIAALNYSTKWNRQDNEVAGWQNSSPAFGLTLSGARDL